MVTSSSSPIKRLYPTTSALRIAANRRAIPGVTLGVGSSLEAMVTGPSVVVDGSIRCFLQCRFGPVSRANHDRLLLLTQDGNKHTDTGRPLPDFFLQNICEFAAKSVLVRRPVDRRFPCST